MTAGHASRRVGILIDSIGPYHAARLRAASDFLDVLAIEGRPAGGEYGWERPPLDDRIAYVPFPHVTSREEVSKILSSLSLDAIAIPGWSNSTALMAVEWAKTEGVAAIVMSETNGWDFERRRTAEWIKAGVISHYQAALVSSASHRDYLRSLGMAPDRIFFGYNVVDNDYFARQAERVSASGEMPDLGSHALPEACKGRYFLTSNRFIEKKNLPRVIEAYADFRKNRPHDPADWPLVLLGDGDLRAMLEGLSEARGLSAHVHFAGFRQIDELPSFYATAGAFIHASTIEQWGLVVNEAMASGLPVAVSNRCGCAEVLVEDGVSGLLFDPYSTDEICRAMQTLASDDIRPVLSRGAVERIADWGPQRFGSGMASAVARATEARERRPGLTASARLKLAQKKVAEIDGGI